jgi:hypothetical protein
MAVTELYKSRRIIPTANGVVVLRYYEMLQSDLSVGACGYTASGLPAVGSDCTWTNATWDEFTTTPHFDKYDLDPRSTKAKAIVVGTASASRKFV